MEYHVCTKLQPEWMRIVSGTSDACVALLSKLAHMLHTIP